MEGDPEVTETITERIVTWIVIIATLAGLSALFCIPMVEHTPCATEDSTWCHWDAETQGNGQGTSFTTYWEGFTVR